MTEHEMLTGRQCPPCDGLCNSGRFCPARRFGEPMSWSLLLALIALIAVSAWDGAVDRCGAVWLRIRPKSRYEWLALGALLSWAACFVYIAVILVLTLFKGRT